MSIAVVLKGYPRLSETFIAQELLALEQAGHRLNIISLRKPYDPKFHPIHEAIQAPIAYLPEYLHDEPGRVWTAFKAVCKRKGFARTFLGFLKDLLRDPNRNRIRRFGQALVLTHELPKGTDWLYAHFLHTPASVTRYTAQMTGLKWSTSAHARDIWTSKTWEKREKLRDMQWLATCTRSGWEHLRDLSAKTEKVHLVYHGLDLSRFPTPQPHGLRDGLDPAEPMRLLSVGRCVEKKGYSTLLKALAALPRHFHWHFTHIGGGALSKQLKAEADSLGISSRITWRGACDQTEVIEAYGHSDLFVLPSLIAADGDRDGLPNVLMEAQNQALACISTRISGIPELIDDGMTGLLVDPGSVEQLSAALEELFEAPCLRQRLGQAGYERVRHHFSFRDNIGQILQLFAADGIVPDKSTETTES